MLPPAVAITPVIYVAHWIIDAYLGDELAHELIEHAEDDDAAALV